MSERNCIPQAAKNLYDDIDKLPDTLFPPLSTLASQAKSIVENKTSLSQEAHQCETLYHLWQTTIDFKLAYQNSLDTGARPSMGEQIHLDHPWKNFQLNLQGDALTRMNKLVELSIEHYLQRQLWLMVNAATFGWTVTKEYIVRVNMWNSTPPAFRAPNPLTIDQVSCLVVSSSSNRGNNGRNGNGNFRGRRNQNTGQRGRRNSPAPNRTNNNNNNNQG